MKVFYYQFEGKNFLVCTSNATPSRLSPIWKNCNTAMWIVPGTNTEDIKDEGALAIGANHD